MAKPLAEVVVVGPGRARSRSTSSWRCGTGRPPTLVGARRGLRGGPGGRAGAATTRAPATALAEAERLRPGDGPDGLAAGLLDRIEAGEEERPWSGIVVLAGK